LATYPNATVTTINFAKSTDFGLHWTTSVLRSCGSPCGNIQLNAAKCAGKFCLAGGFHNDKVACLFRSNDGGVTWTKVALPANVTRIAEVAVSSPTVGLVATQIGYYPTRAGMLRTTNSGASFAAEALPAATTS
jgi:photosystem II stability/assembly factor-like uncharacterized protein